MYSCPYLQQREAGGDKSQEVNRFIRCLIKAALSITHIRLYITRSQSTCVWILARVVRVHTYWLCCNIYELWSRTWFSFHEPRGLEVSKADSHVLLLCLRLQLRGRARFFFFFFSERWMVPLSTQSQLWLQPSRRHRDQCQSQSQFRPLWVSLKSPLGLSTVFLSR